MKKMLFLLTIYLFASPVLAAPDCYINTKTPAHEFPFVAGQTQEVTGLSFDGNGCVSIKLYKGEPVFRQKIYVPFRNLYETYAKAIESKNSTAIKKAFTWLAPTPRSFEKFYSLASNPETPPMPWGSEMMNKIINLLAPFDDFIGSIYLLKQYGDDSQKPRIAWPALYLLMGGEILPHENPEMCLKEWKTNAGEPKSNIEMLNSAISWRFPIRHVTDLYINNNACLYLME